MELDLLLGVLLGTAGSTLAATVVGAVAALRKRREARPTPAETGPAALREPESEALKDALSRVLAGTVGDEGERAARPLRTTEDYQGVADLLTALADEVRATAPTKRERNPAEEAPSA